MCYRSSSMLLGAIANAAGAVDGLRFGEASKVLAAGIDHAAVGRFFIQHVAWRARDNAQWSTTPSSAAWSSTDASACCHHCVGTCDTPSIGAIALRLCDTGTR
jgi:hypothetical protein